MASDQIQAKVTKCISKSLGVFMAQNFPLGPCLYNIESLAHTLDTLSVGPDKESKRDERGGRPQEPVWSCGLT